MTSFIGDTCMSIYQSSISFIKVGISAKRYEELQNSEKETVIKTLPQEINQLAATHLGFSYSNDSMVLNDINFDLEKGDILVITGNIGAGKSTLSKIIAGIYSQNSGEIRINQEKADIALLRNNVAYVDQNSQLITGTITQNISSFDENNDSGTITRILESVNLQGWVESLHQKQNTVVNSSNETISGGQRQRISIARALYKKAEILVLDEPTASLDQENRDDLLLLIKSIAKTHMIIIVTHDTAAMGIATKNLVLT
jgi:ABC-type bacteriocin/lantibiotic exporter with double-glycine peptidase domain